VSDENVIGELNAAVGRVAASLLGKENLVDNLRDTVAARDAAMVEKTKEHAEQIAAQSADFQNQQAELKKMIVGVQTQVTTLAAQVTTLTAEVTTLKAENTTLKAENTALKAEVTTLKADVTTLKAENTVLKAEVTALKAENTTLKAEGTAIAEFTYDLFAHMSDAVEGAHLINQSDRVAAASRFLARDNAFLVRMRAKRSAANMAATAAAVRSSSDQRTSSADGSAKARKLNK
jgi:chromosome segregation ATPase